MVIVYRKLALKISDVQIEKNHLICFSIKVKKFIKYINIHYSIKILVFKSLKIVLITKVYKIAYNINKNHYKHIIFITSNDDVS